MPNCSRRRGSVDQRIHRHRPSSHDGEGERSTNLREDASAYEDPLELVPAGTRVTLLRKTPVERYYKVRLPSGREGWVYGPNITIEPPSGVVGPAGVTGVAPVPELPDCDDEDKEHHRWEMKTREACSDTPVSLTVAQMLNWRVPIDLPKEARFSNDPIARLEEDGRVYALTGYVRHVRFQADCDYHVQVAGSAAAGASEVIVEIPRSAETAQEQLMTLLGFKFARSQRHPGSRLA